MQRGGLNVWYSTLETLLSFIQHFFNWSFGKKNFSVFLGFTFPYSKTNWHLLQHSLLEVETFVILTKLYDYIVSIQKNYISHKTSSKYMEWTTRHTGSFSCYNNIPCFFCRTYLLVVVDVRCSISSWKKMHCAVCLWSFTYLCQMLIRTATFYRQLQHRL